MMTSGSLVSSRGGCITLVVLADVGEWQLFDGGEKRVDDDEASGYNDD